MSITNNFKESILSLKERKRLSQAWTKGDFVVICLIEIFVKFKNLSFILYWNFFNDKKPNVPHFSFEKKTIIILLFVILGVSTDDTLEMLLSLDFWIIYVVTLIIIKILTIDLGIFWFDCMKLLTIITLAIALFLLFRRRLFPMDFILITRLIFFTYHVRSFSCNLTILFIFP